MIQSGAISGRAPGESSRTKGARDTAASERWEAGGGRSLFIRRPNEPLKGWPARGRQAARKEVAL